LKALVQRVTEASVGVEGEIVGEIGSGLVVLLGVGRDDGPVQASRLAEKVARLRVFEGPGGHMDRSLLNLREEAGKGEALCVSQFTLYGDTRRGLRPSFTEAAPPDAAETLYEAFCGELSKQGVSVATGRFGARMSLSLTNDGPVTLLVEV
jgi:D-tyrosyl-tRNA(Tyr) deacylase